MNIRALVVTVSAVAAAAAGALAPSAASAAPAHSASARTGVSYSTTAFKATNRQRHAHDRSRLKTNACLTRYARAQATAMAQSNTMYHQAMSPIQAGCKMGWVGENVAYGFPSGSATVNTGWMHSAGHRANLLSSHYKRMGIAAVQSSNGTWYVSQVFGKHA